MRILYVVSYYKPAYVYGGPVRSISALCEAMAKQGAQVTVLTTNANGNTRLDVPTDRTVDVNGVQVFYFPVAWNGFFFYAPKLAASVQDWAMKSDVAVLEALWTYPLGPAVHACLRARVPYVIPLRGQLLPWALEQKSWKKRLYLALLGRRYLSCATALQCSDPAEVKAASKLNLRVPTFLMPNGIDTMRFLHLPERGQLRERLGIPKDAPVLLFLGRLNHIKRPDIAIQVLAAVRSTFEQAHLLLVGPDEEQLMPMLNSQAQQLGCANHVHWVGLLKGDQVLTAFADADVMLMPSQVQESFGMSAVEAMAAGVPVLVSDGVPVGRWAEEAGAGRQIPCTVDAFAQAAHELLAEPNLLKEMSKRGQELARARFDIQVIARRMLAQYQAIAETGKLLPESAFERENLPIPSF